MTNRAKAKGDRAELEVQGILRDLLGVPARRKLGAGRQDDMGDIDGVPDTCLAVANYSDVGRAIRDKLDDLEEQRRRSGCTFAAMFVRRRGGRYAVVMSPEQWATYARETLGEVPKMHQALGVCWCGGQHSIEDALALNEAAA